MATRKREKRISLKRKNKLLATAKELIKIK